MSFELETNPLAVPQPEELARRLAQETWAGAGQALAGAWSHLLHQTSAGEGVRKEEASRTRSTFRTETHVLEDYADRYPLELLQNAHDAAIEGGVKRATVWMHVSDTALLVGNEGRAFDEERIGGLLNLAQGTKRASDHRHHTIGYKGIGFTSVFQITERPMVFSSTVEFCLDGPRARPLVEHALGQPIDGVPRRRYAFPIEAEDLEHDGPVIESMRQQGAVTVVRLPFRSPRAEVADGVRRLVAEIVTPELLLFLPALKRLVLSGTGPACEWSIHKGKPLHGGHVMTIKGLEAGDQRWLVYAGATPLDPAITAELPQEVWKEAAEVGAAVAVPWCRNRPDPSRAPGSTHVYFPTQDRTGRALLVHGDFYVHSDRTRIQKAGTGSRVTEVVGRLVASLVAQAAVRLAGFGADLISCLAPASTVDGYGRELNALIDEALRHAAFLRPAAGSQTRRPVDLRSLGAATSVADAALILSALCRPQDYLHEPGEEVVPSLVGVEVVVPLLMPACW